jgi:hypothetical protein
MKRDDWRPALLVATIGGTGVGYLWLMVSAEPRERASLLWLTGTFTVVALGLALSFRKQLDRRTVTSNLALGSILHLVGAGAVVAAAHLWKLGLVPGLSRSWVYFLVGVVGTTGALLSWARAKPADKDRKAALPTTEPEPPPEPTARLEAPPDWDGLMETFEERADAVRLRQLAALRRLSEVLDGDEPADERVRDATLVLRQEVTRLHDEAVAARETTDDDDPLSRAAAFFEWGAQKLPELADLDVEDLLLAQVVAEIRAWSSRVEHRFIDHRLLIPIHPIDRPTAEEKCAGRAAALREATGLLRANGMRLSEDLIAAHSALEPMSSVTGFQVVSLGEGAGFVTFEGNGRAFALQRAFADDEVVQVEVRHFCFDDADRQERVRRHVQRVRRANGIAASTR